MRGPASAREPKIGRRGMSIEYRAAVLHAVRSPMTIETVTAGPLSGNDVLVRIKAAGLCHTDLEVIAGSLRYPMPIVLGHEASGGSKRSGRRRAASLSATT